MVLPKCFLPILHVQMKGGGDNVAGEFVAKLDDIFAEVGFDRCYAMLLQVVVDGDFLADHGLALGDGAGADALADRQHSGAGGCRIGAPVHVPAGRLHVGLIFLEVEIEIRQRVIFDVASNVPQFLELRQPRHRRRSAGDKARAAAGEGLLKAGVGQGQVGVVLESRGRGDMHGRGLLRRLFISFQGVGEGNANVLTGDSHFEFP